MRVALTGTPGTGKTTVAKRLADDHRVIHLGDVIEEADLVTDRDAARHTDVIDVDGLRAAVADVEDAVFESHLSHLVPVERAIVLRCAPDELVTRLRARGMRERSIDENVESEALDLVLAETVQHHGAEAVVEIDTTGRDPADVVADVEGALAGTVGPRVGIVDFTDHL